MTKKPFLNALCAGLYIALIASTMFYGQKLFGPDNTPRVLIPIAMLSLLVLSASIMGCLFFYQPVRLYLDGEKQKAVRLLFSTIGIFAIFTLIFFVTLFLTK